MTKIDARKRFLAPVLGLLWVAAVFAAYHAANTTYYLEKVSVFARFLIGPP